MAAFCIYAHRSHINAFSVRWNLSTEYRKRLLHGSTGL
nr:MAG TPA: hypothetical protein [Caudoviricetes sp.]